MKVSARLVGLFGSAALAAQGQSTTEVYGVLDAGVVVDRGCVNHCNSTRLASGVESGSRLGIRGREEIAGGTAVVYALEAGVQADTGRGEPANGVVQAARPDTGGPLFGRQAYVGLVGPYGAVRVGRQYSLDYLALIEVADPFKGGLAGSATKLVGYSARRIDNSVQFALPDQGGVSAVATYGLGERPGNSAADRAYGVSLGYVRGPLTLRLAHQNRNATNIASGNELVPVGDARNTIAAANLDFGMLAAYAAFSVNRGPGSSPFWNPDNPYGAVLPPTPSLDSRDALVGVAVPLGRTTLLASVIHKNDREPLRRDATQVAIGASYALTKRSDVYAAYAHIHNHNGAAYTVGNASEAGTGNAAINIGLRHAF